MEFPEWSSPNGVPQSPVKNGGFERTKKERAFCGKFALFIGILLYFYKCVGNISH